MGRSKFAWVVLGFLAAVTDLGAQSPGVLYTWSGTGDVRKWFKNFGTNDVTLANTTAGELTVTETGAAGSGAAISDDFNEVFEGAPGIGGLDLTGLSSIEIDMGHNGAGAINVQFFVQASPSATFVALGPDQAIAPGVATYTASLGGLTAAQIAYIRTIGINLRDHAAEGNLIWTLKEVRSAGTPLTFRDYATHGPSASDGGLQGAIVNFDNAAVQGNDGTQNQTGLHHDLSVADSDGTLRWVDLASGNGAAVSYGNGTVFNNNTFNERPTDMSSYQTISLRIAATNAGGSVASVDIQYFIQSGGFNFHAAGPDQTLPADGNFHELCFSLAGIPSLNFVEQHGLNLRAHAGGDLIIDVDNVRALAGPCVSTPVPALSIGGWLALCFFGILAGSALLLRRRALSN